VGDIFHEIEEDLRQERLEKLWKAYWKHAVVAAIALVIGVAGYRGWQSYTLKQHQAQSAQYTAALSLMNGGKEKEAGDLFAALSARTDDSYGALARFQQAALKARTGDTAGAVAIYDALARDDGLTTPLRRAAVLLAVMHAMDQPKADAKALAARLDPLLADHGPWRSTASELSGLLALRSGDTAKARERFKAIADDTEAPPNIRARATEVLAVIGS
jgi:hypothetical protein